MVYMARKIKAVVIKLANKHNNFVFLGFPDVRVKILNIGGTPIRLWRTKMPINLVEMVRKIKRYFKIDQ